MASCVVSGTVTDPSGTALSGVVVEFNTQSPTLSADPVQGSTTTASDGTWSMALQQSLGGVFTILVSPTNTSRKIPYKFNVNIPAATTAPFSSIVVD